MDKRIIFFGCCCALFAVKNGATDELTIDESIGYSHVEHLEPLVTVLPSKPSLNSKYPTAFMTPIKSYLSPSNLTQFISTSPSVSQNGQGGHFQNYSIRGVSRHRIKTLINDVRIESDRRAGVSASFIEPLLIEQATVWKNPVSTQFGSGALGGAVNLQTKHFVTPFFSTGYQNDGNENFQVLGMGSDNWSVGMARRSASQAYAADDTQLNTQFTQYSAAIHAKTEWQGLHFSLFALPSIARDVGKSNIDFPERVTLYPEEKHVIVKLDVSSDSGWQGRVYIHPNDLETQVHKLNKSLSTVSNKAFDVGTKWQYQQQVGDYAGKIGLDYFSRQQVNASEQSIDLRTQIKTPSNTLEDGEEHELGILATLNGSWEMTEWEIGARYNYFIQSSAMGTSEVDDSWSGFFSIAHLFDNGWELTANVASGFRFPSLSERFFSGTTGRGKVTGNPNLKKEQSINVDLGVKWQNSSLLLQSHVFYLSVNDYIERVETAANKLTFLNLNNGRIMGVELEGKYFATDQIHLTWGGHFLDGEDDQGQPLSDIPSNRLNLGLGYKQAQWDTRVNLELRANKDDPGNGEKKISSAKILSAGVRYQWSEQLLFSINANNLLNQKYYQSADRKSTFAKQRSFGFSILWEV